MVTVETIVVATFLCWSRMKSCTSCRISPSYTTNRPTDRGITANTRRTSIGITPKKSFSFSIQFDIRYIIHVQYILKLKCMKWNKKNHYLSPFSLKKIYNTYSMFGNLNVWNGIKNHYLSPFSLK